MYSFLWSKVGITTQNFVNLTVRTLQTCESTVQQLEKGMVTFSGSNVKDLGELHFKYEVVDEHFDTSAKQNLMKVFCFFFHLI